MKQIKRLLYFTLIELIIVVAIIAVLVSILLPALSKAKDMSKRISCGNNMKQLGVGVNMYTVDGNGYFPITNADLLNRGRFLLDSIAQYVGTPYVSTTGQEYCFKNFDPYQPISPIFYCPSNSNHSVQRNYGANYYLIGNAWESPLLPKTGMIKNPSRVFIDAECQTHTFCYWDYCDLITLANTQAFAFRHNTKFNMLYVDGHVASLSAPLQASNNDDRFYWKNK